MISVSHALCSRWWQTNLWWEDTGTGSQTWLDTNLRWSPVPLHCRTSWKHLCWSTRTILRFAGSLDTVVATCYYFVHPSKLGFLDLYYRTSAYRLWRRRILRPSCRKWKKCGPAKSWAWWHSRTEENSCWKWQRQPRSSPSWRIVWWCWGHCWATGTTDQTLTCNY